MSVRLADAGEAVSRPCLGARSRGKEELLEQDVDRPSAEPARRRAGRSCKSAIAAEALMNHAGRGIVAFFPSRKIRAVAERLHGVVSPGHPTSETVAPPPALTRVKSL